jgi:hypothetical protein
VTKPRVVCVTTSVWVCGLVAVWEDQSVAESVGKHRSVQLKQIRVKHFNNSCAPVAGVAAVTPQNVLMLSTFLNFLWASLFIRFAL